MKHRAVGVAGVLEEMLVDFLGFSEGFGLYASFKKVKVVVLDLRSERHIGRIKTEISFIHPYCDFSTMRDA